MTTQTVFSSGRWEHLALDTWKPCGPNIVLRWPQATHLSPQEQSSATGAWPAPGLPLPGSWEGGQWTQVLGRTHPALPGPHHSPGDWEAVVPI